VNHELVALAPLGADDRERLAGLLERHVRATGSARATALLERADESLGRFRRLMPRESLAVVEPEEDRRTA
jgi:glutamate synthase domain-containing protein 3